MTLTERELEVRAANQTLTLTRRPSKNEWKEGGGVSGVIIRARMDRPEAAGGFEVRSGGSEHKVNQMPLVEIHVEMVEGYPSDEAPKV